MPSIYILLANFSEARMGRLKHWYLGGILDGTDLYCNQVYCTTTIICYANTI